MGKSKFKDDNFIVVQGWMVNKLKLKGNDLLIYALVYGFSQNLEGKFSGSLKYIEDAIGISRPTVLRSLNLLVEKGLIYKTDLIIHKVKYCEYEFNEYTKATLMGGSKETLLGGSKETLPNNISLYNINNNIIKDSELDKSNTAQRQKELILENSNTPLEEKITKEKKKKERVVVGPAVKKKSHYENLCELTKETIEDKEITEALDRYLEVRITRGMKSPQWVALVESVVGLSRKDALSKIKAATAGGYMRIVYENNTKDNPKFKDDIKKSKEIISADKEEFIPEVRY